MKMLFRTLPSVSPWMWNPHLQNHELQNEEFTAQNALIKPSKYQVSNFIRSVRSLKDPSQLGKETALHPVFSLWSQHARQGTALDEQLTAGKTLKGALLSFVADSRCHFQEPGPWPWKQVWTQKQVMLGHRCWWLTWLSLFPVCGNQTSVCSQWVNLNNQSSMVTSQLSGNTGSLDLSNKSH